MLIFHYCQRFKDNLKHNLLASNIERKLDGLTQRNTLNENTTSVSAYTSGMYVLKIRNQFRIIIQQKSVELSGQQIIVHFVRDVVNNNAWTRSIYRQLEGNLWLPNNPLSETDIETFGIEYEKNTNIIKKEENNPPQELMDWLPYFSDNFKLGFDVLETEEWVRFAGYNVEKEGMREKDVATFRFALREIVDRKANPETFKKENGYIILEYVYQNIGILYTEITENNNTSYLLYGGANVAIQKEHWERLKKKLLDTTQPTIVSTEDMRKEASRAYPSWTLKEDELWDKIQSSSENSNYSLLTEQIDFLKSFKFPCYINGQAGSGKSTMLYYLFANAYYFKGAGLIKNELIFLTENSELLNKTKIAIRNLLANNTNFKLSTISDFDNFDTCFATFKDFLWSLLQEEDQQFFPNNKYLNFPTFKNLYETSNLPKKTIKDYPADKVWFAITTYIYGYDINKLIDSTNYEEMVIRDLKNLLPLEDLKGIEKNCLPFYQKLIEKDGHWDKLKIIRYIEENLQIPKDYAVIFCDEAQDFSRVELNFILNLSELTQYDLKDTFQVPIVFAGDPHQTVNPTGFREAEIKDILYKQLKEIANFQYDTKNSSYNPKYNYRSSEKVVDLANYIQYFRKKSLNLPIERPQEAKRSTYQNIANNIFQYPEEILADQSFLEKFRYKVFIIPVDGEDEKKEFIENNPLLTALPNLDIKTSVEAKGVEYSQVVLYGFGEYYLTNFTSLANLSETDSFKCRYFFNKLYVGVTRAQIELIIIDNSKAECDFWKKLVTEQLAITDEIWQSIVKQNTILYHAGTIRTSTKEDALENAKKDKEQGRFDKNSNRLKIAASQFFALGEYDEHFDCLALAEEFVGEWKKAAEYYAKTKHGAEKQAEVLWKGKLLKELMILLGMKVNNEQQTVRLALARLISDDRANTTIVKDLYQYKNVLKSITKEITWRNELIEKLSKVSQNIESDLVRDFCDVLEEIAQHTDNNLYEALGYLYQKAGYHDKAISSWDKGDYINNKDYINAVIQNAQYKRDTPIEIIYQDKMLAHDAEKATEIRERIIHLYTTNTPKDDQWSLLAAYKAFLVQQPKNTQIIQIAQDTEKIFQNLLGTLVFEYEALLKEGNLDKQVAEFVVERWAKNITKNPYKNTEWLSELNNAYKEIAAIYGIKYQPFKEDEFAEIADLPTEIFTTPTEHFKNITFKNFRRFKELTINNIGQFNLIVGDNNVGKTSVLEGLLFTPDIQEFAKRLVYSYADRCNGLEFKDIKQDFWKDFLLNTQKDETIQYILSAQRKQWQYKFPDGSIDISKLRELEYIDSIKTPMIPFGKGFRGDLKTAYEQEISPFKPLKKEFVENMKVFIPEIEGITGHKDGGIGIEEKDVDESTSLHQYGEGANKLFRILMQMALQKDKRIMIDEIDAGIHYTRFPKFWEVILKVACQNNIQIFATTHNLECIEHFKDVLSDYDFFQDIMAESEFEEFKQKSRVITLKESANNNIKTYTRTFEEFEYALERGSMFFRGGANE